MMLGSRYLPAEQVCSELHDKVIGGNPTVHPETDSMKEKALSYITLQLTLL